MATQVKTVHRLKVTLRQVKPPVWRRIEVPSNMQLSVLSAMLESAMGWLGGHLHSFEADGVVYEWPDPEGDFDFPPPRDERKARVAEVLPVVTAKMRWDYDFGDGWEHDIVVEAIEPTVKGAIYPVCLAGKRACPPDDSGGPWGYANLLAAVKDPKHEQHDESIAWLPEGFDPEEFDNEEATELMRSPRLITRW
jgi:Plasmid pRiA4b ORF-3-like protein